MAINHDIEDYDQWKSVLDRFPPSQGGATFHRINRNVDDPTNITVVVGFESPDTARAFRDRPVSSIGLGDCGDP
ncbi:MAG: hypothetical protein R3324_13470 [Halobacteriales archaeon]|nr:hypothetical protein [Halobacteriales archaeon]